MGVLAGVFSLVERIAGNEASSEFYFAFHTLLKITTHLVTNFIDFYSQLKLILKGKTVFSQFIDLLRKLRKEDYLIFLNGILMDTLSEVLATLGNQGLAAAVFSFEPNIGTAATTVAGIRKMDSHSNFRVRVRQLFENPAVPGMNLAAFATGLLGVAILGEMDQFHNPLAVLAIGGLSEPILASLATKAIAQAKIKKREKKLRGES